MTKDSVATATSAAGSQALRESTTVRLTNQKGSDSRKASQSTIGTVKASPIP